MIHRLEIFEIHCCKSPCSSFSLSPKKINKQMAGKKTENGKLFIVFSHGATFLVNHRTGKHKIHCRWFIFHVSCSFYLCLRFGDFWRASRIFHINKYKSNDMWVEKSYVVEGLNVCGRGLKVSHESEFYSIECTRTDVTSNIIQTSCVNQNINS